MKEYPVQEYCVSVDIPIDEFRKVVDILHQVMPQLPSVDNAHLYLNYEKAESEWAKDKGLFVDSLLNGISFRISERCTEQYALSVELEEPEDDDIYTFNIYMSINGDVSPLITRFAKARIPMSIDHFIYYPDLQG